MTFTAAVQAASLRKSALTLAAAAMVWLGAAGGAAAQVRFHGEAGGSYSVSVTSWRDIPFRTVVRQQYDYSCGSAALATLLHFHYGLRVGESDVFQAMYAVGDQARIQEVGFSMLDMKSYLEQRGFADFEAVWNGVVLAVRAAPDGTAAPAFNREEEWLPWAVAPLGDAQGPVSPSSFLREMPELYQITPVRVQ
jgi:hypothetical protein